MQYCCNPLLIGASISTSFPDVHSAVSDKVAIPSSSGHLFPQGANGCLDFSVTALQSPLHRGIYLHCFFGNLWVVLLLVAIPSSSGHLFPPRRILLYLALFS